MIKNSYTRILATLMVFCAVFLVACSPQDSGNQGKKNIVVASYPEYDWLCQILGEQQEQFNITLLMDKGVDLHSYQPSIKDMAQIAEADLFVYNGGVSYTWVNKVLKQSSNVNRTVINLVETLGDHVQTTTATCSHEHCTHAHAHAHAHSHDCDHDHEAEHVDEHIWLSLRNAMSLCAVIEDAVSNMDPAHAEQYESNKGAYVNRLKEMDARFTAIVKSAPRDTIIVADRFPFLYLMEDYGIKYHAAFEGCSAETEASFETVTELVGLVNELKPHVILTLQGGMDKLAQTILSNSEHKDCQVMELNAIHTVTPEERAKGVDYASIMEGNLKVLETALAK